MKKHVLKIKHHDTKYSDMQISADTTEELQEKKDAFLSRRSDITYTDVEEGSITSREEMDIDGEVVTRYAHSDMIYLETEDNTAAVAKMAAEAILDAEEAQLQAHLAETDYLVIRKSETAEDYDQAIKDSRAAARVRISEIRVEKAAL